MANPRTKDIAEGQKLLEAHVQKTLYENNVKQAETVNGMMKCRDAGCDFEAKSLSFAFPIQPWQANRVGNLHGGLICTAFDVTIAANPAYEDTEIQAREKQVKDYYDSIKEEVSEVHEEKTQKRDDRAARMRLARKLRDIASA